MKSGFIHELSANNKNGLHLLATNITTWATPWDHAVHISVKKSSRPFVDIKCISSSSCQWNERI